jgi:sugar lactone lactonase YvrE
MLVLAMAGLACGGSEPTETQVPDTPAPPADTPVPPTDTPLPVIRQWASDATASSEYSDPSWAAVQAVGEPDTPECGDYGTAWASSGSDTVDWLEVTFDVPVYVTEINIVQTFNPDQVVQVDAIDADGELESIYTQEPVAVEDGCPYTLSLEGEATDYAVYGLRITVDQSVLGLGWNEIDAVEIVGVPVEGAVIEPPADEEPAEEAEPADVIWRAGDEMGFDHGQFNSITGMDVDAGGILYVADNLGRILAVSPDGEPLPSIEGEDLWNVSDVAIAADGTIYAADWGSNAVYAFSPGGDLLTSWGQAGTGDGEFGDFSPDGIAVCPDGTVYVADTNVDASEEDYERVQIFDGDGVYLGQWSISEVSPNYSFSGMDCGPDGNVYMVGFIGNSVLVFDSSGNLIDELGEDALSFTAPNGLAVGPDGGIYVGTWNEGLVVLDADGNLVTTWGENVEDEGARVAGQLYYPDGVAVDADGGVYLGDWGGQYSYVSKFELP